MKEFKLKYVFRLYFIALFLLIAVMILLSLKFKYPESLYYNFINETPTFIYKLFWCISFTLLGFCLLCIKLCINEIEFTSLNILIKQKESIDAEIEKNKILLEKNKIIWRYILYYPIMIIVLSALSLILSVHQLELNGKSFFEVSAVLSFIFGYLVDSLPRIFEKLGGKLGAKE